MNPGQVAKILHEVSRAQGHADTLVPWERESPAYRETLTRFTGRVLAGEIQPEECFAGDPIRIAIGRACMSPLSEDEPESEPERRPGYSESALGKECPAYRAAKAPGECVTLKNSD